MRAAYPLPILLTVILGAVSCSRTGDLSGDVFIKDGGKPERGAGVEVLIIPASDRFESKLRGVIREYDQEHGEEIKREEKECEKDKALNKQIETDPALQKKTSEYAKVELLTMKETELATFSAKMRILVELGGGKCPFVPRDHDVELGKLINARVHEFVGTSEAKTFLADVNGHYEVNGLPVGRYYLSAMMGADYIWLVPVQITPGTQKVHLSNANSGSLRFLTKDAPNP
jgi:hypothetical protein